MMYFKQIDERWFNIQHIVHSCIVLICLLMWELYNWDRTKFIEQVPTKTYVLCSALQLICFSVRVFFSFAYCQPQRQPILKGIRSNTLINTYHIMHLSLTVTSSLPQFATVCSSMVWTNNTNSGWAIFSLDSALCKQSLLLRGGLSHVCVHWQHLVIPLWRKNKELLNCHICLEVWPASLKDSRVEKLAVWDGPVRTEGAAQSMTRNFIKPLITTAEISVVSLALWIPRDVPPVALLKTHPATLLCCSAGSYWTTALPCSSDSL